MNKNDLVMLMMAKKTLDYQKDPNPDNWVTISGAKVHLDEGGKIDGGAKGKFNGKSYSGTKKSRKSGAGTGAESSKKYESKAREAVEYWVNTHYKNPSDKNIKDSVESVRMQMESMVKSAERNLNDAKKTGKEDLIKEYQNKYDEAKGTLEALNNYYDGGTVKKEETAKEPKKPAVKNSAAESLIDYVKQQTNIDLSKHRDTEREKRGQLLINWKELDRNQKFAIQTLAQKGKFELIDNGGYGYILKPTKEPKTSATKPAENKDVRIKLKNGVTLRWQEVPGEPDKVYNPETREMCDFKGGLKAAIERAKSQGATVEEYEKEPYDPYQAESKNRQDRRLARSAAASRRAGRSGRPTGAR